MDDTLDQGFAVLQFGGQLPERPDGLVYTVGLHYVHGHPDILLTVPRDAETEARLGKVPCYNFFDASAALDELTEKVREGQSLPLGERIRLSEVELTFRLPTEEDRRLYPWGFGTYFTTHFEDTRETVYWVAEMPPTIGG